MFSPVLTPDRTIDEVGAAQEWIGVMAVYKKRPDILALLAQAIGGSVGGYQPNPVGNFDGGFAWIITNDEIHFFIGPASGIGFYVGSGFLGLYPVYSPRAKGWTNTLWQQMTDDLGLQIENAAAVYGPAKSLTLSGFSQGAAMAYLIGRDLSFLPSPYRVSVNGFGSPRSLADSALPDNLAAYARIVNASDPVDLVPPQLPMGDPILTVGQVLPMPVFWTNRGTRFVLNNLTSAYEQIPDPPSPNVPTLVALLATYIQHHTNLAYSSAMLANLQANPSFFRSDRSNATILLSYLQSGLPVPNDVASNLLPLVFRPIPPKAPPPLPPGDTAPVPLTAPLNLIQEFVLITTPNPEPLQPGIRVFATIDP